MSGSANKPLAVTFTNKSDVPLTADTLQAALQIPAIKNIARDQSAEVTQDGDNLIVTFNTIQAGPHQAEVTLCNDGTISGRYPQGDALDASNIPRSQSDAVNVARVIATIAHMNLPTARADA